MKTSFYILLSICCFSKVIHSQGLPIKPVRTISFTTDEGSYMNVDVSPDGKTLAFDLLGDIYTVPVTGGAASQLTRGMAINLRPVWSPDGKKIAYISDNSGAFHVNVLDVLGKFNLVLGAGDPAIPYEREDAIWTGDGCYISTYLKDYTLAYPSHSVLHSSGLLATMPLRYVKDTLYYSKFGSLYKYNTVNDSLSEIAQKIGPFESGVISPDAHWWVYTKDSAEQRSLMIRDLQTQSVRVLIPSLFKCPVSYISYARQHFCFSPDSRVVYIFYGGKIHRIDVQTSSDTLVNFKADVKIDLGERVYNTFRIKDDSFDVRYIRDVRPRPDGEQITFSALNKIYVMDLPNGKPRLLINQPVAQFQPEYSPDGKWIAYVSWSDTVGGYLWKVPASGGKPIKLTALSAECQRPAWSPDGKYIAVIQGKPHLEKKHSSEVGIIKLFKVDGSPQSFLSDTISLLESQLAFSEDSKGIVYQPAGRIENDSACILACRDIATGKTTSLLSSGSFNYLQQRIISPDGKFLVYSYFGNLFLVPRLRKLNRFNIFGKESYPLIHFALGVDPGWERNGKILYWTSGGIFYRIDPEKVIKATEDAAIKDSGVIFSKDGMVEINVVPDEVNTIPLKGPSFHADGTIALVHAKILTMENNKIIEDGSILIGNGRIVAVGRFDSVHIPKGPDIKVIDLHGATIMPGLIDVHNHVIQHSDIIRQQAWPFLATLAYGVTTIRDPAMDFVSFAYSELLAAGKMIGPRFYTVGRTAAVTGGLIKADNYQDLRDLALQRREWGGICVKQYAMPDRLQRQWALLACKEFGLNMTNEGLFDPLLQIGMIKDGSTGVEHNPMWGDVYNDVLQFYALSGTNLTPVLQACYGAEIGRRYMHYKYWHGRNAKMEQFIYSDSSVEDDDNAMETTQIIENGMPQDPDTLHPGFLLSSRIDNRLLKLGAKLVLGGHGNDEGICTQDELWSLQMGGISNMDVLRIGTIESAKALGLQSDIGSLEIGKLADLLILDGNPLEDIHHTRDIQYVMKGGVLYNGNSLDEVWPVRKPCPKWKLK